MTLVELLATLLSLAFILVVGYTLWRPSLAKPLLRRTIYHHEYAPYASSNPVRLDEYLTFYPARSNGTSERSDTSLLVFFIGGAFLFNNLETHYGTANRLYEFLNGKWDIAVLGYPVRFETSLSKALTRSNEALGNLIANRHYGKCVAMGFSAGALMAGAFIQKEKTAAAAARMQVPRVGLTFDAFVAVCGLFDTNFDNVILTKLFRYYIMRGTPNYEKYWTCFNLGMPSLVISSRYDLLVAQTRKFIATENCEYRVFEERLPHAFIQIANLPQNETACRAISDFLVRVKVNDKK